MHLNSNPTTRVRTRFAPSPTGQLHIGGARTALFSYLFAQQHSGDLILRIEDTDRSRYVAGAESEIEEGMAWLGIRFTESPLLGGAHGPYRQSERRELYQPFIDELLKRQAAYWCFCTPETLQHMREDQQAHKLAQKYDGRCRSIPIQESEQRRGSGEASVLRLKFPTSGSLVVHDLIRGDITFNFKDLDDQVLLKSDNFPTYHLASVLDDYLMKITHVIRGEEWLPSTPKHVFLLRALDLPVPEFAHLPMVLNTKRQKMSKRSDGEYVWLSTYRKEGYLPEAVVNFIALLGWNPKTTQECFSMEDLIRVFDFGNVHKSAAVFDLKKLRSVNATYLRKLPSAELVNHALPFLIEKKLLIGDGPSWKLPTGQQMSKEKLSEVMQLEVQRLERLCDVGESTQFFFVEDVPLDVTKILWKQATPEATIAALQWSRDFLETVPEPWNAEALQTASIAEIQSAQKTNGEVLFPLRYAITGQQYSPTPFECLSLLGKSRSFARIDRAISALSQT
ncbi:MAG: glutamate--tRNA ligase [Candidatus Kerfeldbacteria bacterium]|nr:glutamate--tRNA ligase [Candidatus Kerfeldbacteria bacterium]